MSVYIIRKRSACPAQQPSSRKMVEQPLTFIAHSRQHGYDHYKTRIGKENLHNLEMMHQMQAK